MGGVPRPEALGLREREVRLFYRGSLSISMEFGLGFAFEKLLDYNFRVQLLRNEKGE